MKLQEATRPIHGSPYANTTAYFIVICKLVQSSFKTPQCLSTNNMITESVPDDFQTYWDACCQFSYMLGKDIIPNISIFSFTTVKAS